MAWKNRSTTTMVEIDEDADDKFMSVDLEDFGNGQLLQELIDRKLITEEQAEDIVERDLSMVDIDYAALDEARATLCRGNRAEALFLLERALGGDFVGRLARDAA